MANYLEKIVRLSGDNVGVIFHPDKPTSAQVDTKELLDGISPVRFDYTGVPSSDYVYQSTNRIKAYVNVYTKDTTLPTLVKVEFLKGAATVMVTVKDALIALAYTFDLDPKEIGLLPTGNPYIYYSLDKETHSVCCNDLSNYTTVRKELTEQQFVIATELVRIYELMLDSHKQPREQSY